MENNQAPAANIRWTKVPAGIQIAEFMLEKGLNTKKESVPRS